MQVMAAPMQNILAKLAAFEELVVWVLSENMLLNVPIEQWPACQCLIAFYSFGYPLDKVNSLFILFGRHAPCRSAHMRLPRQVEAYTTLHHPYVVNDIGVQVRMPHGRPWSHSEQRLLLDRREVYRVLTENNIPVPPHIIVRYVVKPLDLPHYRKASLCSVVSLSLSQYQYAVLFFMFAHLPRSARNGCPDEYGMGWSLTSLNAVFQSRQRRSDAP